MADRVITLRSGEVVEDRRNAKKISPSELSW
jgi:putative ABC transport system ATP-binding protein